MKNLVAECRQALATCPHDSGTISVPCRFCLGAAPIEIDLGIGDRVCERCPGCDSERGRQFPQLCACLEPFDKATILAAIKCKKRFRKLASVARAMPESIPLLAVDGAAAEWQLAKLRHWCDANQTIVLPNVNALLFSHLLERGMIECWKLKDGRPVYVARGATQEFYQFIHKPELLDYLGCNDTDMMVEFAYRGEGFVLEPASGSTWDGRRVTEELTYLPIEKL
jgi:hypothetical protein